MTWKKSEFLRDNCSMYFFFFQGYVFSLVDGAIIDTPVDDSIQVGTSTGDGLATDPISMQKIEGVAVRSRNCPSEHLYEEAALRAEVIKKTRLNPHGYKCAYIGCKRLILLKDIMVDDEYARYLQRRRRRKPNCSLFQYEN